LIIGLSGCTNMHVKKDETEDLTNILNFDKDEDELVTTTPGSLYSDMTANGMLFLDHKARRKNDIVTVKIIESSKASDSASTNASKKTSASAGVSSMFGFESGDSINKTFPSYRTPTPSSLLSASMDNSFNGAGATTRQGTLIAMITAVVTKVLPNGNLVIQGSREVTINSEKQVISVKGIIRPKDIGPDNTILSTAIAQAELKYGGRGFLSEKQREGWGMRIFNWVWPF
jgi:flagellar L-ring protein FlgH